MNPHDRDLLRGLAEEIAGIAALPVQKEKRRQWQALNALKPERPLFTIDQVPWHEMAVGDELTLRCTDSFLRGLETEIRRTLYKWRYMPDDLVIESHINVPMAIDGLTYGIGVAEEMATTDTANDVYSHAYIDQLQTEEDLEKLRLPAVSLNREETARREEMAHSAFDGVLEVRMDGYTPAFNIWDKIAQWRGVNTLLYDLVDRPEFMHRLMDRVTRISLAMLDQLEAQGLLGQPQATIHCSGAWCDELPQDTYNPHPKAKDLWTYGMAQIFSTVSPDMHEEFEIEYARHWYARFGLGYYGCCEPLDRKMAIIRKLPNIRKVAMSPWADIERGAAEIGGDYVLSSKPTPAHLAADWDPRRAQRDIEHVLEACSRSRCPVEFLLKDISTVLYKPQNLWEWADVVRSLIN